MKTIARVTVLLVLCGAAALWVVLVQPSAPLAMLVGALVGAAGVEWWTLTGPF